jgi:GntR family transcriptional repressor for pyruvate dehydrogenase complex
VEIRTGSGVYVLDAGKSSAPSTEDQGPGPFEILEARRLIEGEACALAAERVSEEQLAQLEAILVEMEQENLKENMTEQADEKFHCLIAEAAGNSAIAATIDWLWQLRNESVISTHFHQQLREEGSRPIIADHRRILDALEARNPDAAREAMSKHLQRVIDTLMAAA